MKRRVVITGVGLVTPIGSGKDAFWDSLKNGRSGLGKITLFDTTDYASHIAGEVKDWNPEAFIEKKKVSRMDRFTQFAMAAAKMAVQDAKLDPAKENPERCGVIVGSGIGGLMTLEEQHRKLLEKGPRRVSPFLIPMMISNMPAGEIAIEFGFAGVNFAVSSACATSNHAMGEALRHLRYGDADVVIAGGSEAAICPMGLSGFCSARALTTEFNDSPTKASRPFDKNRSGFVMGEGAGIVVLETLEHAQARGAKVYAELAGYGATDDAYHITAPSPEGKAAARAIELALADGDLKPVDIDYVNAHGTSTDLNDKTETAVIKKVFGEHARKLAVSSTKSMTGHLLGATSAVELIATVLCMEHAFVHPTINQETPDPECDLDYVPNVGRPMTINAAVSNSLGFGGHNAVVAVRKLKG